MDGAGGVVMTGMAGSGTQLCICLPIFWQGVRALTAACLGPHLPPLRSGLCGQLWAVPGRLQDEQGSWGARPGSRGRLRRQGRAARTREAAKGPGREGADPISTKATLSKERNPSGPWRRRWGVCGGSLVRGNPVTLWVPPGAPNTPGVPRAHSPAPPGCPLATFLRLGPCPRHVAPPGVPATWRVLPP